MTKDINYFIARQIISFIESGQKYIIDIYRQNLI